MQATVGLEDNARDKQKKKMMKKKLVLYASYIIYTHRYPCAHLGKCVNLFTKNNYDLNIGYAIRHNNVIILHNYYLLVIPCVGSRL